jgi:large subunit ribosomal protein L4
MNVKVYSIEGKELRNIELPDEVFGIDISKGSIYNAVINELANMRLGTAKTKDRAEVHGSSRKLFKQKGTGRARAGNLRSPLRVKGGVIFGPRPRDYSYKLPKKMKRLALRSILSLKAQENSIRIIEDFDIESGKTRELASILKKNIPNEKSILILKDESPMVKRAGRNIPWLGVLSFNRLAAHSLYYAKHVVIQESAVKNLSEMYATQSEDK